MTVAIETSNLQELGMFLGVDVGDTLKIKRVVKSCVIELLTQGNYLMAHILMALEKVVGEKGINPAKLNKNRNLIDESHQVRQFLRLKAQVLQKVCKAGVYVQIPSLQSNLGFLDCCTLEQEGFFYKANHINQVLDVVGEKLEGANFYTPFVRYDLHSKGKNHSFIVLVQDLEMATAKNHQGTAFYPLEMAVLKVKPFEPFEPSLSTKLDEINEELEVLLTFLDLIKVLEKVR